MTFNYAGRYSVVSSENGGRENLVALLPGYPVLQADSGHPNFSRIRDALAHGTEPESVIADLFDGTRAVAAKFAQLSERTAIRNGHVLFDGDPVPEVLERQVLRFMDAGIDQWQPLINFWELLSQNPQEHSRTQALDWLNTHAFAITPEGHVVGYKGLGSDGRSIHSGGAVVNGVQVSGSVPNEDGSVIEMARSSVQHDPRVGCSYGLHVGTLDYASSFGSIVKMVTVNPRDIVSVPTECSWAKMRTCRYTVVKQVDGSEVGPVYEANAVPDDAEELCGNCESELNEDGYCWYCD